jgi:uncharacterized integral membrane protein
VSDQHARNSQRSINWKLVGIGILAIILIVFALLNRQDVRVHFIVRTVATPLILVIVVCALLGFVIGWLLARHRYNP